MLAVQDSFGHVVQQCCILMTKPRHSCVCCATVAAHDQGKRHPDPCKALAATVRLCIAMFHMCSSTLLMVSSDAQAGCKPARQLDGVKKSVDGLRSGSSLFQQQLLHNW